MGLSGLAYNLALAITAVAGCLFLGMGAGRVRGAPRGDEAALVVGISLSLTGDFSDPGKAAMRGYQLWAAARPTPTAVSSGGRSSSKIVDDTSSPNQVVTNYQNLINRDHVDLVFGPFVPLLTAPAARVAYRYHYAFVEPAGGGPSVFAEHLDNVFFVQPAPVAEQRRRLRQLHPFAARVQAPEDGGLSVAGRPVLVAHRRPHAQPVQKAGIKTVFKTIYPPETTDLTPIVAKVASANPDMVVAGTQSDGRVCPGQRDGPAQVQPQVSVPLERGDSPVEFPSKVGPANVKGIFSSGDWFPDSKSAGNPAFVAAYLKKYGGTRRPSTPARPRPTPSAS